MSFSNDTIKLIMPTYKVLDREGITHRIIVIIDNIFNLNNSLSTILSVISKEEQEKIEYHVFPCDGKYCLILSLTEKLKEIIEPILIDLRQKKIIKYTRVVEPLSNILITKNITFIDENFARLNIYPMSSFIGIFANLYNILGQQGDYVIERLGYYYGKSYVEYLLNLKILDKPQLFRSLFYSIVTGVSLGLFSLIDITTKSISSPPTCVINILIKNYYEEEGYAELGLRKCGIFLQGFFKGILEYHLPRTSFSIIESICYNENKESLFVIELPQAMTKEDKEFLNRVKKSILID